ncbi:MAG: chromosome segregation protein SMC, partial [Pseudomonadota bacterium]
DLWRWDGFGVTAEDSPSAAALRLQQVNKLASLRQDLEAAETRMESVVAAHQKVQDELADATEADRSARTARKEADAASAEAGRALSRADNARGMVETKVESAALALQRHKTEAEEAHGRLEAAEKVKAELPPMEEARQLADAARETTEAARKSLLALRSEADATRAKGEARRRRARSVETELADWTNRMSTAEKRASELETRHTAAEQVLAAALGAPEEIAGRKTKLAEAIETAETRRKTAADALAAGETAYREADTALREATQAASQARETRAAAEARVEAQRGALSEAEDRIQEAHECAADELLEKLGLHPEKIGPLDALENDIARLKRQRDALGAVNLRAEEDAHEVETEHEALSQEKADLEGAIRTLRAGIASLNREGRERLLTAFEQV